MLGGCVPFPNPFMLFGLETVSLTGKSKILHKMSNMLSQIVRNPHGACWLSCFWLAVYIAVLCT